jgi:hypothetical protein
VSHETYPVRRVLLEDGSLHLDVEPELLSLVERWLPRLPETEMGAAEGTATIEVVRGEPFGRQPPQAEPTLEVGSAVAWVMPEDDGVLLQGSGGKREGLVDLTRLRATLRAGSEGSSAAGADLYSMLTVSAAMLLGRLGRALLHAAAVVTPAGKGWLLAGDARSGKSTTCVNLVQEGWDFLSDDQVVLYRNATIDSLCIEGWPRPFHVDEGWEEGTPRERRLELDPFGLGTGEWRRTAVLGGALFPRVRAGEPTVLEPAAPADALAGLIRQSPWLLADPSTSERILGMLQAAALGPAFKLFLGRDTFHDSERLLECLRPLLSGG